MKIDQDLAVKRLRAKGLIPENKPGSKRAGVLVPLEFTKDGINVILTLRSSNLRSHAGEVSFPGGRREESDASIIETAKREAFEEIGLIPDSIICALQPVVSKSKLHVTPVVSFVSDYKAESINREEVEEVFRAPLEMFLSAENYQFEDITFHGFIHRLHIFTHGRFEIWGLTAGILVRVAMIVYERQPEFQLHADGQVEDADAILIEKLEKTGRL